LISKVYGEPPLLLKITPTKKSTLQHKVKGESILWKGIGRYLKDEDKNKEKFIEAKKDRVSEYPEERIFRSGDIAEFNPETEQLVYIDAVTINKRNGILVNLDQIAKEIKIACNSAEEKLFTM